MTRIGGAFGRRALLCRSGHFGPTVACHITELIKMRLLACILYMRWRSVPVSRMQVLCRLEPIAARFSISRMATEARRGEAKGRTGG
jgi:hypothetical protein